jgi:hypothetical protein
MPCIDCAEEAEGRLRCARIWSLNIKDSISTNKDLTLVDSSHNYVLRRLDEVMHLSRLLRQEILGPEMMEVADPRATSPFIAGLRMDES